MRRSYLFSFLFLFAGFIYAGSNIDPELRTKLQSLKPEDKVLVWVFFNDKGQQNLKKQPAELVSIESVKRRAKYLPSDQITDISDVPVSPAYIRQLQSLGFEIRQKSKWLNGISGYIKAGQVSTVSSLAFIRSIEPVAAFPVKYPVTVNVSAEMPALNKSSYSFNYGNSLTQLQQINVPQVHDLGYTAKGIKIGVFDAGFNNLKHEVFSRMNIIAKWDFVNKGPNVQDSIGLMGEGSHGTATLSLIGGFKEGELIGPAFEASYILAKTENTVSETPVEEDNWIAAAEWADSIGVDIISTSLGYLTYDKPFSSYTWQDLNGRTARITKAAAAATRKGIVIVVSAGNEGLNTEHNTLGAPADADTIISVGAVTSTGVRAAFSSVGPTSDGRIKPDVTAMGQGNRIATRTGYSNGSGTSYSCPLTAGVAALLLQANPALTPLQVRDALRSTASRKSTPDNLYGWGIINALDGVNYVKSLVTSIGGTENPAPGDFTLYQNYPNPFNPSTTLRFYLPAAADIKLELYNVLGVKVASVFEGNLEKGSHSFTFNGSGYASGIYFARLSAGNYKSSIKLILQK